MAGFFSRSLYGLGRALVGYGLNGQGGGGPPPPPMALSPGVTLRLELAPPVAIQLELSIPTLIRLELAGDPPP